MTTTASIVRRGPDLTLNEAAALSDAIQRRVGEMVVARDHTQANTLIIAARKLGLWHGVKAVLKPRRPQ